MSHSAPKGPSNSGKMRGRTEVIRYTTNVTVIRPRMASGLIVMGDAATPVNNVTLAIDANVGTL